MATLYRYFDAQGRLLYVGVTATAKREAQHSKGSRWYSYASRCEKTAFPNMTLARQAEGKAILLELPIFNFVGRYPSHDAWYVAITEYENAAWEARAA